MSCTVSILPRSIENENTFSQFFRIAEKLVKESRLTYHKSMVSKYSKQIPTSGSEACNKIIYSPNYEVNQINSLT